jgi:hypothetical protein
MFLQLRAGYYGTYTHIHRSILGLVSIFLATNLVAPALVRAETEAPTAAPARHLYLMEKPLPMDVRIGPKMKALHYIYWASEILFKTGLVYVGARHVGAHAMATTISYFAFAVSHSVPYITVHSMIDLKIRQALKSSLVMGNLRSIPGIKRAVILSGGEYRFEGLFARERSSQNYVFVETDKPIDCGVSCVETFGEPIDVSDSAAVRLSFRLVINGDGESLAWEAPLTDFLDGKPIPEEVADAWRAQIRRWDAFNKKILPLEYHLGKHNRFVRVDATMTLPSGKVVPLKAMITGGQVRKLLGLSILQRMKDFFVEKFLRGEIGERSVALDEKRFRRKRCETLLRDALP